MKLNSYKLNRVHGQYLTYIFTQFDVIKCCKYMNDKKQEMEYANKISKASQGTQVEDQVNQIAMEWPLGIFASTTNKNDMVQIS